MPSQDLATALGFRRGEAATALESLALTGVGLGRASISTAHQTCSNSKTSSGLASRGAVRLADVNVLVYAFESQPAQ